MFEAQLLYAGTLKDVITAVSEVLLDREESNDGPIVLTVDCTSVGLSVQGITKNRVVLAVLWIERTAFEYYHCRYNMKVGINLNLLLEILKNAKSNDRVSLRISENENALTLIITGPGMHSQFTLGLQNDLMERFFIPAFMHECIVKMPAVDFSTILDNLGNFGSFVTIACQQRKLTFTTIGNFGMGHVAVDPLPESSILVDASHRFDSMYLKRASKSGVLSQNVTLSVSESFVPIIVEYNILTSYPGDKSARVLDVGSVRYYIGPLQVLDGNNNNNNNNL